MNSPFFCNGFRLSPIESSVLSSSLQPLASNLYFHHLVERPARNSTNRQRKISELGTMLCPDKESRNPRPDPRVTFASIFVMSFSVSVFRITLTLELH